MQIGRKGYRVGSNAVGDYIYTASPSTLVEPNRRPFSECLWEYIGLGESPAGSNPAPETGNSHERSSRIFLNVPEECRGNYITRAGSNPVGSNRK